MDAMELMLSQRACRAYLADPVPLADLEQILRAATHAPSAENSQPWVFVVVTDPERRAAVSEVTAGLWRDVARAYAEATLVPAMFDEADRFMTTGYGGAPALVIAAGDGRQGTPTAQLASSIYPALQNLLLAAAALGYGSAMTTLATYKTDELAVAIELPEGIRPFAVVPIGRPARPLGPPRRRPVAEVAHLERFGTPFTTGA
jgi:nitroreductase